MTNGGASQSNGTSTQSAPSEHLPKDYYIKLQRRAVQKLLYSSEKSHSSSKYMELSRARAFGGVHIKSKIRISPFIFLPNHCWAMNLLSRMQKKKSAYPFRSRFPFYIRGILKARRVHWTAQDLLKIWIRKWVYFIEFGVWILFKS